MIFRTIAVAAWLAAICSTASAYNFNCRQFQSFGRGLERPDVPSCLQTMSFSHDEFTFSMCRNEMVSYQSDIDSYLRCLKSESTDAVEEADEAVQKFNCYASGRTFCP